MKKFFIVVFGSLSWIVIGQHIEEPKAILSPNASSLGQFGDVPISFYNGAANVNIPLLSLNELNVALDISLSYNTSGVRVNDVPSWVGQNWSLNAGGVITRTVQGSNPDEYIFESGNLNNDLYSGYCYQKHKLLDDNSWSSEPSIRNFALDSGLLTYDVYNQDLEPDIFTFNFMGHSGKFFYSETGEWKVRSESNLKVEIDLDNLIEPMGYETITNGTSPASARGSNYSNVIGKITLIDDQGYSYVFGGTHDSIEYSLSGFFTQSNSGLLANAWNLTKVIDPQGNVVYDFEYERGDNIASFYQNVSWYKYEREGDASIGGGMEPVCRDLDGSWSKNYSGTLNFPSYLTKISTVSGEEIVFNRSTSYGRKYLYPDNGIINAFGRCQVSYFGQTNEIPWIYQQNNFKTHFWYLVADHSTGNILKLNLSSWQRDIMNQLKWKKLNSIESSTKTINFTYNEDTSKELHERDRLALMGVSIDDKKYSFSYNNFSELPDFMSLATDHWGYYNGNIHSGNFGDVSHGDYSAFEAYYPTRNSNFDKTLIGSLESITHPTGGTTSFKYEINKYGKYVDENKILQENVTGEFAGGLRIAEITKDDGVTKYTKKYYYSETPDGKGESTGILLKKNKYYWPLWSVQSKLVLPDEERNFLGFSKSDPINYAYYEKTFNADNLLSLANTCGSLIGYSKVYEVLEDGSFTAYEYTNYEDPGYSDEKAIASISPQHSVFDSYVDKSFMRGKIKCQTQFDNMGRTQSKETYFYEYDDKKVVRAVDYRNRGVCLSNDGYLRGVLTGSSYVIYYSDFNNVKVEKEDYLTGDIFRTTTHFAYTSGNQNYTVNSDNFLREKTIYSYLTSEREDAQYHKTKIRYSFDETDDMSYELLSNERRFAQIETVTSNNEKKVSTNRVLYKAYTTDIGEFYFPYKTQSSFGDSALRDELIFDAYDAEGNVLLYHRLGGLFVHYVYAYNNKYPVAKVECPVDLSSYLQSQKNDIEAAIDNGKLSDLEGLLNSLRNHDNAFVTTYTYLDNIGVKSITDSTGKIERYEYDNNERLIRIVDHNGNTIKEFEYNYKQ